MPSTINADNGVSSGSAGLKSSADSSGVLQLQTNGTTAVTVDTSQNVGIGTSSPAVRLDVVGTTTSGIRLRSNSSASNGFNIYNDSSTDIAYLTNFYNGSMVFGTNNTERMRIDSSGNLGLGVTPSAWGNNTAIQVHKASFWGISSLPTFSSVGANYYWDTANYRYISSAQSSDYYQFLGQHIWRTAPSGTAGNVISFTQAMTLDSSGNLLVGTTSGVGRLRVKGSGSTSSTVTAVIENSAGTQLLYARDDGFFAIPSSYNNTNASAANVWMDGSGFLYRSTSSLKYKTDVQNATHGLAEVMALRSVTYKGKNSGNTVFGGLIAEEVHEAGLTEFVQYAEDGSPDALHYGNMVALCVKAIQELKAEVDSLKSQLAAKG